MNKQGEMQIPFNLLIVLGKHINTSFHLITNICKFKMSVSLSNKGKKHLQQHQFHFTLKATFLLRNIFSLESKLNYPFQVWASFPLISAVSMLEMQCKLLPRLPPYSQQRKD